MRILDFSFSRYINFEAHIQFPEEGGIVQVGLMAARRREEEKESCFFSQ